MPGCKSVPEFYGLEESKEQGYMSAGGRGHVYQQYHNVKIMVTYNVVHFIPIIL